MTEQEAAGRYDNACADDAVAQELDFGTVVGVAFRWGEGGQQRRLGVPMRRETAKKLWRQLGDILGRTP